MAQSFLMIKVRTLPVEIMLITTEGIWLQNQLLHPMRGALSLAGMRLMASRPKKIEGRKVVATLKKMKRLADGGDNLRRKAGALLECIETLKDHLPDIPDSNCSCHLCPPCSDCVNWSALREAMDIICGIERDLSNDSRN